ncbi:hypothetical protein [Streptomyces sp. NPDC059247]|uniref:hypothetical protein n=1 Tax=Streptomyces sp. NPDC059247 TaxID=3346790 RepID=UPI00369DB267
MISRHFIAPSSAFTRFSHELIRHPRLSSDAVRLLTWQLSLPGGATENLSRTAERAGIGATAFTRAKRQLISEGFVHERRVQGTGGCWSTQQLVSATPLTAAQASKLLGGTPVRHASAQVAPGPRNPAVGAPGPRPADGHPEEDPREKTSHLPPETGDGDGAGAPHGAGDGDGDGAPHGARSRPGGRSGEGSRPGERPGAGAPHGDESRDGDRSRPGERPGADPPSEDARALVGALPLLSPALRFVPAGMRDELARLAARWLAAGHTPADVHAHVLRGLPRDGTPVHRPGGLLRYLLREVPPRALPAPAPPPPGPRLSARLADARECEGTEHTQPMLFRPVADERLCPRCAEPTRPPAPGAPAR